MGRIKHIAGLVSVALVATTVSFALAEGAARFYARYARHQGLFRHDYELGWRPLSNVDFVRFNANGEPWQIHTNRRGFRGDQEFRPGARRRVLVAGDSFVFGEGVNEEDRFDAHAARHLPEWSFVNIGVMGFGVDQSLIAARRYYRRLRREDLFVLVINTFDFYDVLKTAHSGRTKPWFELRNGSVVEHSPEVDFTQVARDRSYVAARVMRLFASERHEAEPRELDQAGELILALLESETRGLVERGVRVLLVIHTIRDVVRPGVAAVAERYFESACELSGVDCLFLDEASVPGLEMQRLKDGHWNAAGHRMVGEAFYRAMTGPGI